VGHTGVDLCDGTFATVATLREVNHSFSGLRGRRPTQIRWSGPAVYAISGWPSVTIAVLRGVRRLTGVVFLPPLSILSARVLLKLAG
jgi:hypothetical protein